MCFRLKRPVRCMLDRDEDMLVTGGRHPYYGKYKVGWHHLLVREPPASAAFVGLLASEVVIFKVAVLVTTVLKVVKCHCMTLNVLLSWIL